MKTKFLLTAAVCLLVLVSCKKGSSADDASPGQQGIYVQFEAESPIVSYTDNNPDIPSTVNTGIPYGPCKEEAATCLRPNCKTAVNIPSNPISLPARRPAIIQGSISYGFIMPQILTAGFTPTSLPIPNKSQFTNMKPNLLTMLSLAFLLFTGCKKSDDSKQSPLVGSWKKTKVETKAAASASWVTDTRSCYTDDVEEFEAGGSWTSFDGTKQCSAGSGIIKGSWRLAAGDTKVVFNYQAFSGDYESTIETLTAGTLVLTHSAGDLDNTQVKTTYQK